MNDKEDSAHDDSGASPKTPRRLWQIAIGVVVVSGSVYFIARSIWTQWDAIAAHQWQFQSGWLVASAVMGWISFALLVQLWRSVLVKVANKPLRYRIAYRATALANLGKYLPGKVWSVMGLLYFLHQENFPRSRALAGTVLHQAYTVFSGAVYVSVVLGADFWRKWDPIFVAIVGFAIGVVLLYPPLLIWLINRGLRLVKRDTIDVTVSFGSAILLFSVYLSAWVLYGAAFWLLLNGIGLESPFWRTGASFAAAYLAGFLAIFAPAGIGVREGVLIGLLEPSFGAGIAALAAIVARLWSTLLDLIQLSPLLVLKTGTENRSDQATPMPERES